MKQEVLRSYFDPKHSDSMCFQKTLTVTGTVKKPVKIQGYLMVAGETRWEPLVLHKKQTHVSTQ